MSGKNSGKNSGKKYAVIYFINDDLYSEIPVSWLTPDKKKCWWPKSLNAKANMKRGDTPQENWEQHNIRVDSYCSTLESARLKAEDPDFNTSSSESFKGRGFRKKKTKKYSSSEEACSSGSEVITPPPTPSSRDVIVIEVPPDPEIKNKKINNETKQNSPIREQYEVTDLDFIFQEDINTENQNEESMAASGVSNTVHEEAYNNQCQEGQTTSVIQFQSTPSSQTCQCQNSMIKEMFMKMSKVEKLVEEMSVNLSTIKVNNPQGFDNKKLKVIQCFPFKTKEEIIEFDKILVEEDLQDAFGNYIKGIGGKDVKDFVNRILNNLFTNELGKLCSLVGLRGNFRLDGFTFMKILQEIILVSKGSSTYDIQKAIGEWFRLSNQRLNRQNKSNVNQPA